MRWESRASRSSSHFSGRLRFPVAGQRFSGFSTLRRTMALFHLGLGVVQVGFFDSGELALFTDRSPARTKTLSPDTMHLDTAPQRCKYSHPRPALMDLIDELLTNTAVRHLSCSGASFPTARFLLRRLLSPDSNMLSCFPSILTKTKPQEETQRTLVADPNGFIDVQLDGAAADAPITSQQHREHYVAEVVTQAVNETHSTPFQGVKKSMEQFFRRKDVPVFEPSCPCASFPNAWKDCFIREHALRRRYF